MGREQVKERDEKWDTLKRRVIAISRLEGHVIALADGVYVYSPIRVKSVDLLVERLREGAPSFQGIEATLELERPAALVTRNVLAVAQRDLRALAATPARALARERKKVLARYGDVDEAWLRAKARRLDELSVLLDPVASETPWFDHALGIIRAVHGDISADAIAGAHARLVAEGTTRRKLASDRLDAILGAMTEGLSDATAERLERIGELPGRARRARALAVLHEALGTTAPVDAQPLADKRKPWIESLREVGHALVRAHPSPRSPSARADAETMLAWYGLSFRAGQLERLGAPEVKRALELKAAASELRSKAVTIEQALALVELPMEHWQRREAARLVSEGLEIEHVAAACSHKRLHELIRIDTVRAARAYSNWATRLVPHYEKLGISLELTAELFANLPKNEDLAVLALCLVDAHFDRKENDPLATLDSTLGLFQKLPSKASNVLARLRGSDPGGGRRIFPELAEWLGEDDLLDRFVHLTRLAGQPVVLTARLREDFDHAEKAAREQSHLEAMSVRSTRQEARLRALRAVDRSRSAAPRGRTRRRLQARVEELLPIAYRRELDQVFREILREAWQIDVPRLTPAWRDAVRFWLGVDNNRDVLGQLLRASSKAPGRDVKRTFPRNEEWIDKARRRFVVDAWLAPRRENIAGYVVSIEEDPLEVLRMGIPFETCLSLTDGCNAASTVVNAVDANKRVLYVRTNDGAVVARKLLAIDKKDSLIGYNLYLSVRGGAETEIRRAITEMCRHVAHEAGVQLANVGEAPERLHGTFWYDDGIVAFDEDVDVAVYCRALGLEPLPSSYDALVTEAKGRAAMMANDVERAMANLTRWDRGAANVALGRFVVDRLGEKETIRRAGQNNALVPALMSKLADEGVNGMLRLFDAATRLPEETVGEELARIVARFPTDRRLARGLADLAVRAARVHEKTPNDESLASLAIAEVEKQLEDVPQAFDLFDRMHAACTRISWVPSASIERLYRRSPDPEAVVACLSSRRRSTTAVKAAIRVAAAFDLPGAAAALERLAKFRPELASYALVLVARVRHQLPAAGKLLPDAFGDLVLSRPQAAQHFDWQNFGVGSFPPGPWALAYLSRHPSPELTQRLLEEARRSPRVASRALELLASMGDREAVREITLAPRMTQKAVTEPRKLTTCEECNAAAQAIRRQVSAADKDILISVDSIGVIDRGLLDLAMKVLDGSVEGNRVLAREVVSKANGWHPFAWLFERCFAQADERSAEMLATKVTRTDRLDPKVIADAFANGTLNAPIVKVLATQSGDAWAARIWAIEREHAVPGLFEAVVLERLVSVPNQANIWEVETPDQLRSAIKTLVTSAPPLAAATAYQGFPDDLTAAMFLKAMPKLVPERAAQIREAAKTLTWNGARSTARKAWLEATRLRESSASSIER